jgi:hypothetical protein
LFYSPQLFQSGFRLVDGTQLNAEEGDPHVSTEDQITATGTTVLDARPLRATVNSILTVTPGSGVVLPPAVPGLIIYVFNRGASALTVYGQAGQTLDNGLASVALAALGRCMYFCATPGQWLSAQMGATSA